MRPADPTGLITRTGLRTRRLENGTADPGTCGHHRRAHCQGGRGAGAGAWRGSVRCHGRAEKVRPASALRRPARRVGGLLRFRRLFDQARCGRWRTHRHHRKTLDSRAGDHRGRDDRAGFGHGGIRAPLRRPGQPAGAGPGAAGVHGADGRPDARRHRGHAVQPRDSRRPLPQGHMGRAGSGCAAGAKATPGKERSA